MKVDLPMIEKLADLAKLEFSEKEKMAFKNDFNKILEFVDKLDELDTEGVVPLLYVTDEKNVLREDLPIEDISKEEALYNAPQRDSDYFKVPKVLNKKA